MDLSPLAPGGRAAVSAILLPPPGPALPGAPDHGRTLWFEGIGAVGYAVKPPRALAPAPDGGGLAIWRQRIAARVERAVGGAEGAVAAALLVGIRGAVPEEVEERWRAAGISHILSISGLHIGLAAGIVLFGLRFPMALVPALSLRLPAKKWAAAAALLAAGGYTLVAGMDVPALRSFVMTAVVLLAVMTDRLAITMRLVAIAAVAVLLLRPESLVSPGFGMSFASVTGLVAGYEVLRAPFGRWRAAGGPVSRLALVVAGILISSVIATIATAPFAIAHFGRLSVYGLLANLVAVPATAFAIMPLLVLGAIAMPFGLEALPFHLLGRVIGFVDGIAAAIADMPGAVLAIPAMGQGPLVCFVLGGLWLCLWRRPIRFVAAPLFLALGFGLWWAETASPPRLLIHEEGRAVAAFDGGRLVVLPPAGPGFVVDQWRERLGLREATVLARADVCRNSECRMVIPPGPGPAGEIAVVGKGWIPCVAVVVLPRMRLRPLNCRDMPAAFDRDRLRGAGTIILSADGIWTDVAAARGLRPWTPAWWRDERPQ
ncbi:ComEC/Rec2 family competence protein [Zavarzinia compransoris]|nr:ComEC/Rec2 family competence protein [Zavarzinia marina]